MKQEFASDHMPGTKTLKNSLTAGQHHPVGCGKPCSDGKRADAHLQSSQISTCSTMSQSIVPAAVYQRRKHRSNRVVTFLTHASADTKPSDGCHSAISSEALSVAAREPMVSAAEVATETGKPQDPIPIECNTGTAESFNGCPTGEETSSEEVLKSNALRVSDACGFNERCSSSSKSNLDTSSGCLKTDVDDAGECSSSGALGEKLRDDRSERDICISILRSQGLLGKVWTRLDHSSGEDTSVTSANCCSKTCRACKNTESTLNMLICDGCEDAFHISCCKPHVKKIPVGEWVCNLCLKKKHKLLKGKSNIGGETHSENDKIENSESEEELGPIELVLRDTEPYMSNVRIGDDYQAKVPEWSGPDNEKSDLTGEPLETDPSQNASMQGLSSIKPPKLSSIGNWLQCRELIEGIAEEGDGTICGKWRRAPLFEVQTDDWECFRCILWDPTYADCAVPQELPTEEVMKQLKYIEMLRPRLAARKRKLDQSKSVDSQDQSQLRENQQP